MDYVPIIVFAYNRPRFLERTLKSIEQNVETDKIPIIVYSDGWKGKNDRAKVEDTRNIIKSQSFCDGIFRRENYGLKDNVISGVSEQIRKYEKVIVLEDDLVIAPSFYPYMKKMLKRYEYHSKIFSISGYTPNLDSLKNYCYSVYYFRRASSWGWATWKNRWGDIDWEIKDYEEFISSFKKRLDFNKGGSDLTKTLKKSMKGKNDSWAIRWVYNQWKEKSLTVYPVKSLVKNIGFGENSTHTKSMPEELIVDLPESEILHPKDMKLPPKIVENDEIATDFRSLYSYRKRITNKLKSFFA